MGIGVIRERDQRLNLSVTHDSVKVVGANHRDISQDPTYFLYQFAFGIGIRCLGNHRSMKGKVDTIQRSRLLQGRHNHITTALVNIGMDNATVCEANSDGGHQFYIVSLGTFHEAADKILRVCSKQRLPTLDMDSIHGVVLFQSKGVSLMMETGNTNSHFFPSLIKS